MLLESSNQRNVPQEEGKRDTMRHFEEELGQLTEQRPTAGDHRAPGREVISTLVHQKDVQRWKTSGPLPRAPVWGEGSWRGDKQPKQIIGTTHTVGIYELQKFMSPSKDPASPGAFSPLPKTPASEFKVKNFMNPVAGCRAYA
jgi:hypothetical protein